MRRDILAFEARTTPRPGTHYNNKAKTKRWRDERVAEMLETGQLDPSSMVSYPYAARVPGKPSEAMVVMASMRADWAASDNIPGKREYGEYKVAATPAIYRAGTTIVSAWEICTEADAEKLRADLEADLNNADINEPLEQHITVRKFEDTAVAGISDSIDWRGDPRRYWTIEAKIEGQDAPLFGPALAAYLLHMQGEYGVGNPGHWVRGVKHGLGAHDIRWEATTEPADKTVIVGEEETPITPLRKGERLIFYRNPKNPMDQCFAILAPDEANPNEATVISSAAATSAASSDVAKLSATLDEVLVLLKQLTSRFGIV